MERNGAKQSHISFSRGADDLIRLDAFTIETDEAGVEVLREYVAAGRIELKAISDTAGPDSKSPPPSPDPSPDARGFFILIQCS